ncbi:unnamed protein product [Adineta ricciae]|uniref:EGF-like domain-containing protein n=1 Tax=Adineta ricciae TaxID=249248 RepID=A0A815DY21_ADIRI|nr:unnamed protein product [Adineta ricciae]
MNTNLKCHNHCNLTSFTKLQSQNISTDELYYWQVPIDIIDLYESNECDPKYEYRCTSGMCIDKDFAFDYTIDCLDRSDEKRIHFGRCFENPSNDCEEFQCAWADKYPCGDGECVSNAMTESEKEADVCSNGRNKWFLTTQINVTKNFCRTCLLCNINGAYNASYEAFIDCRFMSINTACKTKCKNILLSNFPLFYPDVRFIYTFTRDKTPMLTCYDNDKCNLYPSNFNYSGLTCRETTTCFTKENAVSFVTSLSHVRRDFTQFISYMRLVFSACALPSPMIGWNSSKLYSCPDSCRLISFHRVADHFYDCPNSLTDETYEGNLCRQNLSTLPATEGRCEDGSDRMYPFICRHRTNIGCQYLRSLKISNKYFLFQEICNGRVHPELIEDEDNCDEWKRNCNPVYQKCNQLLNSSTYESCIPMLWAKNSKTKCYVGVNENNYCQRNYPNDDHKVFRCFNDSKCIEFQDLCDGVFHCPFHDNETICLDKKNNTKCPYGTYPCDIKQSYCEPKQNQCDSRVTLFSIDNHRQYPSVKSPRPIKDVERKTRSCRDVNPSTLNKYRCHRGIVVNSPIDGEQCLCSPAYYGRTCEYQSERISIALNIRLNTRQTSSEIVYKLLIRLQTLSNMFFDSTELYYATIFDTVPIYKQVVYLRAPRLYEMYSIVIDVFQISKTDVEYHSSFYYKIAFPFLPVNRLATRIILTDRIISKVQCEKNCTENGQCRVYSNRVEEYYCLCHSGWSGEFCQIKQQISCSPLSFAFHSHCICPLNHLGRYCYAHVDICRRSSYCQNNGTCISVDLRTNNVVCICLPNFHGQYCQESSAYVNITMNNMWREDRTKTHIPVVIVHMASLSNRLAAASTFNRYIYKNVLLDSNIISFSETDTLPTFVFVEIYFDTNTRKSYHLVTVMRKFAANVRTSILPSNRCYQVDELLDSSIMSLSYIKRIKYYNRPCDILDVRCFYDEFHVCLCNNNAFLDCVRFDHSKSSCPTDEVTCLNDGRCYQPMQTTINFEFACVCPRCYFGDRCQFTMTKYTIPLDALLDQHILIGRSLSEQLPLIHWMVAIVVILVVVGFLTNGLCILTFAQRTTRKLGCGWHLLITSIVSQLGIVIFGIRLNSFGTTNKTFLSLSCILLEFFLSILPTINDWLSTCVTVERTIIAAHGVKFNRRKSVYYAKIVILIVVVINVVSALHKPFHHRLVIDSQHGNDVFACVANHSQQQWMSLYEITINLFHFNICFNNNSRAS